MKNSAIPSPAFSRPADQANLDTFQAVWTPRVLSLLRFMGGLLILQHGLQKVFGLFGGPQLQVTTFMGFGGALELLGGILLVPGLFTRPAAFILAGETAVAYFMEHAPHGFVPIQNKGELAIAYCFIYFFLAFAGGGSLSLDALASRRARQD